MRITKYIMMQVVFTLLFYAHYYSTTVCRSTRGEMADHDHATMMRMPNASTSMWYVDIFVLSFD